MRILCAISFLLAAALVMCQWEGAAVETPASAPSWVRTVDGWELRDSWQPDTASRPVVHPAVVAASQLFGSLLALVVFAWPSGQPAGERKHRRTAVTGRRACS